MNKKCTRCHKDKLVDEFNWANKSKGIRHRQCRDCTKEGKRRFYAENTEQVKSEVTSRTQTLRRSLAEYKSGLKCTLCSEDESCCLDFHHTDPGGKDLAVSELVNNGRSWSAILAEINKCVPLCRNCHAKVHAGILQVD